MTTLAQHPGKENLLYQVCRRMWASCLANIDVFAGKRAIYTDEYIAARVAEIDTAQAYANDAQRTAVHELIRINMVTQNGVCCDTFQDLKLYIRHAYPKDAFDTQYKAAGGDLYAESAGLNWVAGISMMKQGSEFIATNAVELKANQNMPVGFEAAYNEQLNAFILLYDSYYAARQQASEGAAEKVTLNNIAYNQCILMAMDGYQFFKNSEIQSEFSFEAVSALLAPAGASTLIATVKGENNAPIIAAVSIMGTNKSAITTAADGKCELTQLAADDVVLVITADGYVTQQLPQTLTTGVTSRVTVSMVKMVMNMPVEGSVQSLVGSGQASVGSGQASEATG